MHVEEGTRVTIAGNREVYSQILVPSVQCWNSGKVNRLFKQMLCLLNQLNHFNLFSRDRKRIWEKSTEARNTTRWRKKFRDSVSNYDNKCAITGISTLDSSSRSQYALQRSWSNHVSNGIAMRSDVHRLFDLGKIRIHPDDLSIHLHPDVAADYESICAEFLLLPPVRSILTRMS